LRKKQMPKKRKGKPAQRSGVPQRMHLVQVSTLLAPFEAFVDQLKQGEVWVNDHGEALIDLPNQRIEDLARAGKKPNLAVPNLMVICEIYFQVMAYCFEESDLEVVHENIKRFRLEVLGPLREDQPIERASLDYSEKLLSEMKAAFLKAPKEKIVRVMNEVMDVLQGSSDVMVKTNEVRAWLVKELGG
jgi:hypothetical protein